MRKSWYEIQNAANGQPAKLTIEGDIGAWGVSSAQFRSDFGRIAKDEALTVHIMSGGGAIFEGNEIANIIRSHDGEVTVTLGSICASIATVIACAGDKVIAAKNTLFMIHNPSVWTAGEAEDLRDTADIMDKMKGGIIATYRDKTGKPEKELSDAMDEETWMDSEEALAFGFVDEIGEEDAEDEAIDSVELSHYKNSATLSKLQDERRVKLAASAGNRGRDGAGLSRKERKKAALAAMNSTTHQNITMKTEAELAAEQNAAIKKAADDLYKARVAREKEVRGIVKTVNDRDRKDFSAEAEEFLATDEPVSAFYAIITKSDKKPKVGDTIGSGIENMVEPIDQFKGTPGFAFVNSEQGRGVLQSWKESGRKHFSATIVLPMSGPLGIPEFRNTQTSSGLTSIEYLPGVEMLGVRPLTIKDLISPGATTQTTLRYRQENAFADAAATVTETGALPQLTVSYVEVDAPVKDLGGYIEMSENLMADYPAIISFINMRVPYMVQRVTEDQLLNGGGTGSDITGILSASGIQTQAKGVDTAIDAIHKAITNVQFVPNAVQANVQGGYEPDAIVIHPTDWQNIRLAKDANNQYFGGGPFTGAYGNGMYSNVRELWGYRVVITPAIAAGTALVGAFRQCSQWFQRQGLTIELTNSNGTNFINRIVTMRAAERLALATYLPNGFAQVTGL